MSLYDGLGVDTDPKKNVSSPGNKPDVSGWSAGIRMMQSQLRLKKAALTEAQRKIRGATLAPVVDLKKGKLEDDTRQPSPRNQVSPRRPVHGPPRTVKPSPFVAGVIGDIVGDVSDEYDPAYPNEYEKMYRRVREKRQKEREIEWEKERERDERKRRERGDRGDRGGRDRDRDRDRERGRDKERSPQGFSRKPDSDDEGDRDRPRRRGKQGAAIAPPSILLNQDDTPKDSFVAPAPINRNRPYANIIKKQEQDHPERSTTPPPGSEFSEVEDMPPVQAPSKSSLEQGPGGFSIPVGMGADSIAAKIMAKYGFKSGKGLGKKEQGISTALVVEKTSRRGGKIIEHGKDVEVDMLPPSVPLPKQPTPASEFSEVMRNPTKVVLLRNMVGPGEVDEELQPETAEECTKYGAVVKCVIYEEPNAEEEEAVRIFVEFGSIAAAVKAVVDLNGRFFGGRIVKASFFSPEKFKRFELGRNS
ncbi:splicing factor 45-like [Apostichopus japonicus]|uniref:splicing factor 45-like n=1 Tax=Stichopus japonicus TaxID=307972 RepID=UPI003AB671D9